MADILTVTLNPALDIATSAAKVRADVKLRCAAPRIDPGGGGINVSRAIAVLGGKSRAVIAAAGHTGQRLLELLEQEGIETLPLPAPGETRQSFSATDESNNQQYRFVMPGPSWTEGMASSALAAIIAAARNSAYTVLSGSLPPGLPAGFPADLARALAGSQARLIVDTSGKALHQIASTDGAAPFLLRMDSAEAQDLAGAPLPSRADTARFAQSLVRKGAAEAVIVARGADGSVLAQRGGCHHAMAANVPVISKIGAGDSFVGGLVHALGQGSSLPEALQKGAAAASAAVMTEATELCRREDVLRLVPECPLSELPI